MEITKQGQFRLRGASPYWERAQETLRRKLGDKDWANVHNDLDQLIRAV